MTSCLVEVPSNDVDVCHTQSFYTNKNKQNWAQPLRTMDDYLASTLGQDKMCDINRYLYAMLHSISNNDQSAQTQQAMRSTLFKLKATLMHSVYHADIQAHTPENFVQLREWPQIMSFTARHTMLQDNIVVPVPYTITQKKMNEYSTALIQFYQALCKLQGVPYDAERMHLHKYGWLRHTSMETLIKAAKTMTKGHFDTLRFKALRALSHVLGLSINPLIDELAEISSEGMPTKTRAPIQVPLTSEVKTNIRHMLTALQSDVEDFLVNQREKGIWFGLIGGTDEEVYEFSDIPNSWLSDKQVLELHSALQPLVFGLMMYGEPQDFRSNTYTGPSSAVQSIGLRRDHINITFDPNDNISIGIVGADTHKHVNIFAKLVNKVGELTDHYMTIDGCSRVGQYICLLIKLAKYLDSKTLFFNIKGKNRHKPCVIGVTPCNLNFYQTMRKYFNIPAGMGGTIAARMTHAERDCMEIAQDVVATGAVTAEIIDKQNSQARSALHSVNEHKNYAARAAKRKALEVSSEEDADSVS